MIYKYFITSLALMIVIILSSCQSGPSSSDTLEIAVGTLNDEVIKMEVNLSSGRVVDTSRRILAGNSTGIKVPIDIEISGSNKLFVLSQGNLFLSNGSIRPSIRVFNDTAEGNITPETVIDITDLPNFKPVGLAISRDFLYVSYFSDDPPSSISKIIRFDMNGGRLVTEIPVRSLGDIEITKDNSMLIAADPVGNQILKLRFNSMFEVQTGFDSIPLSEPNCIALTDSSNIFVYQGWRSNNTTLNSYSSNTSGTTSPIQVIWGTCGTGKKFITPYGLAVLEMSGLRIVAACNGDKLVTFPVDANGCAEPVQQVQIGSPVSVAFDRLKF